MPNDNQRDNMATPAQGAPVVPSSAVEPDTGVHEIIDPDPLAAEQRMQRRIKETAGDVKDANAGITTLRIETKGHIDRIEAKVDSVETKVDRLGSHVLNLTAAVGPVVGQIPELVKSVDDLRGREHVKFTATVDLDRAQSIAEIEKNRAASVAEIEDTASIRKNRRELKYKIALGLVSSLFALTAILEHC